MSAIGNYIHLTATGYNKTGTNRQREAPSIDAATALSIEKSSIKQRIENYKNMNDLSSLEAEINSLLLELGQGGISKSEEWVSNVIKIINQYMDEIYGEALQNIDTENWTVNYKSEQSKGVGRIKTNYWTYKNWKSTILKRIDELNTYLDKFTENKNTREYKNAIAKIKNIKNEIYKGTYDLLAKNGWENLKNDPLKASIKELNEIIAQYAAMPALSLQRGDLFEALLAILPEMATYNAEKASTETIKKYISGKNKILIEINEETFKDKSWDIKLNEDITQTGKTSQSKVDVTFDWEGQSLNISAKNVNLGEGRKFIHTLGGSSLLYLIQDEDTDFINHYFNLFSNHPDKNNLKGYTGMRKEYFDILKLVIAYKALTGDTFGKNGDITDVFIVNDSSGSHQQHVRVFSVADILKKFQERPASNLGIQNSANIQKLYANKRVENAPSGIARIAAVLNEAHQRKITASFNSDILDWN